MEDGLCCGNYVDVLFGSKLRFLGGEGGSGGGEMRVCYILQ